MSIDHIDRVRAAFATVIGDDAATGIVPGATMEDIEGWDSVNFLNLVMAIEDEFDLQMSTLDAASLNTVDAILAYVERKTS